MAYVEFKFYYVSIANARWPQGETKPNDFFFGKLGEPGGEAAVRTVS